MRKTTCGIRFSVPGLLLLVLAVVPQSALAVNPAFYQYAVRHEKGASPFFPYTSTGQETVNGANGNLFFSIPLVSRPGRNGLGIDLKLAYNSKIWDFYYDGGTRYATLSERDSWVGAGWTLRVARIIDDSANGHYYLTLPDGSNHDVTWYSDGWWSMDSSYMTYDPANSRLTLKGGTRITFGYVDPLDSTVRHATRVQDASGNYIEIAYQGGGGRIGTIQDTLGNTYTFELENNHLRRLKYFNTNDTTVPTSTIWFTYQTQTLAFGTGATTDPSLPAQYELTDVGTWPILHHFTYLTSGEVSQITYPACGKSRYYYGTKYVFDRLLNHTVAEHWITSRDAGVGDASDTWTWAYTKWYNGMANYPFGESSSEDKTAPRDVRVTLPGGSVLSYSMAQESTGWADGLLTLRLR